MDVKVIGYALKWNGSAWAPGPDFGDTNSISRPEADLRYVNASGDTMSGPLTATELYATGSQNWRVGSAAQPNVDVELIGQNSKVTTSNGKRLILAPRGALIQCETNTAVNGSLAVNGALTVAGPVTAAQSISIASPWAGITPTITASSGSLAVPLSGLRSTDIVILTPRGNTLDNFQYSVVAQHGQFVVYHKNCKNKSFNYLVIRE